MCTGGSLLLAGAAPCPISGQSLGHGWTDAVPEPLPVRAPGSGPQSTRELSEAGRDEPAVTARDRTTLSFSRL